MGGFEVASPAQTILIFLALRIQISKNTAKNHSSTQIQKPHFFFLDEINFSLYKMDLYPLMS